MTCRISVVIPTYSRPDLLDRCLTALLEQGLSPAEFEVIVCDDAACEQTRAQVEEFSHRAGPCGPAIRYAAVTGGHGPATARNVGWRLARGEFVAFTDDDCIPTPAWLCSGLQAIACGADGASGKVVVPLPDGAVTDYERNAAHLERSDFVTANCFYRRTALEAVGGFDERFIMAWREDSDLFLTLLERDARLIWVPEAAVVHPVRPAPWGVSIGQQRKNQYNALLYKKHPALYRQHIQSAPPWHYYAMLAALAICPIAILPGWWMLAAAAGCIWLALTARFSALRLRHTSHALSHVAEMVVTSVLIPPLAIYWRLRGALRFRVWFL